MRHRGPQARRRARTKGSIGHRRVCCRDVIWQVSHAGFLLERMAMLSRTTGFLPEGMTMASRAITSCRDNRRRCPETSFLPGRLASRIPWRAVFPGQSTACPMLSIVPANQWRKIQRFGGVFCRKTYMEPPVVEQRTASGAQRPAPAAHRHTVYRPPRSLSCLCLFAFKSLRTSIPSAWQRTNRGACQPCSSISSSTACLSSGHPCKSAIVRLVAS